ncbi:MAG TPA: NYN domain-containing protein [Bacillota bacterium]|jgi:uncharacterized LabA/DUF88 family protein
MPASSEKVAVFIDFENIQYSYHNLFGVSPDPQELIRLAQRYGNIVHAKAFADFQQPHLRKMMGQLRTASIECSDVPAEVRGTRIKDYADFAMLEDIYQTYLDRDDIKTFLLMTGDGHFASTVAKLRVRFQLEVVIVGVKGSVSQELRASATVVHELEGPATRPVQEVEVIRALATGERNLPFVGVSQFVKYFSGSGATSPSEVHKAIDRLLAEGAVEEFMRDHNGYRTRAIKLIRTHAKIQEALQGQGAEGQPGPEGPAEVASSTVALAPATPVAAPATTTPMSPSVATPEVTEAGGERTGDAGEMI